MDMTTHKPCPRDGVWKSFAVNPKLLESPVSGGSPIVLLPKELLIEIFRYSDRLDQICFALSCRSLLKYSTLVSLKTLSPGGYRARCSNPLMAELLRRVEPLDINGQRKRDWAICGDCSRYRPTSRSYWETKRRDSDPTHGWEWEVENWSIRSPQCPKEWGRIFLPQCPECSLEDVYRFKETVV